LNKQTSYFENETHWFCMRCYHITPNLPTSPGLVLVEKCSNKDCSHIKGVNSVVKYPKRMTVKEWKQFSRFQKDTINHQDFYMDIQMMVLSKFDIILTDWKSKKQKAVEILKKFNMKNFDKGINQFNKAVQMFSSGLGEFGNDLNQSPGRRTSHSRKDKANIKKLMGKPKRNSRSKVKIWSDKQKLQKRKRKTRRKSDKWDQDERNVEKLWGKRR